jgi:hypothetical protein
MGRGVLGSQLIDPSKGIREDTERKFFEFYVAGYTKTCKGALTQPSHATLWSDAFFILGYDPSIIHFPFEGTSLKSNVVLIPEPDNQYDPNATIVAVDHPLDIASFIQDPTSTSVTRLLLGYVPKAISSIVSQNLYILRPGRIKRTRKIHDGKACSTKVAIPWRSEIKCNRSISRLLRIVAEQEDE